MGNVVFAAEERYTYGDYLNWPDEERWEIIEGVPVSMSPAPVRIHQKILTEILVQLHDRLTTSDCEVYPAPFDVRLPEKDEADEEIMTVVQPDIAVICDAEKLDDKGCRGAPDFIIEIISPSTASHDQIKKVALYEQHGVREYWIVHPVDKLVIMRRLNSEGVYPAPDIREITGKLTVSALEELELDFALVGEIL
jgi:Uma2 family endonuclease